MQTDFEDSQGSTVKQMLSPLGQEQVGQDPRYSDDFTAVKAEIDRLSDTDYRLIASLCESILREEAKDLRVAGYYLMARVFSDGLDGLMEGVDLYTGLVRRYGAMCHPQRKSAQALALAWLNNDKLSAFVNKIILPTSRESECAASLKSKIESLNKNLNALYGEEVVTWTSLNPWFQKHLVSASTMQESTSNDQEKEVQSTKIDSSKIVSELDFTRRVEGILEYLTEQGDLSRLVAVSRAIKWSFAKLPPSEDGRTKISPPRQGVIAVVEKTGEPVLHDKRLEDYESYFMESGCQLYLDLQVSEIEAAKKQGMSDIAELIELHLQQLIQRHPRLLKLTYSDGRPFANEVTRRKLNKSSTANRLANASDLQAKVEDFDTKVSGLMVHAGSDSLAESIEKVSQLDTGSEFEAFRINLSKLEICSNAGRPDLALPLARKLEKQVERYRLEEWDKPLALELWDKFLAILQTVENSSQETQIKIEELKEKICAADLSFALKHF